MKYGIMYYKETDNIGDDIQTYVAKRFLPHIDYYIDRESLNCFVPKEKEYVSVIMNGWFLHNKCAWPPSPYINPLLISMHFTSLEKVDVGEEYLKGYGGEYLKKNGSVGCRDIETQKRLDRNNIENYFSGCMTLTTEKFENVEKEDYICIVDVEDDVYEKIRKSTKREIKKITHSVDSKIIQKKSFEQRMNDVEELLKTYQAAHIVVTSRLHVALPSIALGTPVILIVKKNYEKDRLETFLKYPSAHYFSEEFCEFNNEIISDILEQKKENNNEYKKIREKLIEKCTEFIEKSEKDKLNNDLLPDVIEYSKNYVKKIEWYKELHEILRKKAKANIYEYEKNYRNFQNEIENMKNEIENMKNEKDELEKTILNEREEKEKLVSNMKINEEKYMMQKEILDNIYNSKSWKLLEKYRKIKKNIYKRRKK